MEFTQVDIITTHEGIEPVSALLLGLGIAGFAVEDSQDFNEFLETAQPYWDYVDESLAYLKDCPTRLTAYLADTEQGRQTLSLLRQELGRLKAADAAGALGPLTAQTRCVREEDWENNWKQYFKPTPVGERLLIKPTWETLASGEAAGRVILEIDPSASFGTGTHHTTRLCLSLLEKYLRGGERVLDMGCGSGILGIAAMLLGAAHATAVDVDENSVRIARENYALNHIPAQKTAFYCGDINRSPRLRAQVCKNAYQVVVANIVADVILAMGPSLKACVGPGGVLLLSGIIEPREEEVRQMVAGQGMLVDSAARDGGWVALAARFPA